MNVRHPFDQTPEPVVLGIEANEEGRVFTAATTEGFRIFDTATGKLTYERGTCVSSLQSNNPATTPLLFIALYAFTLPQDRMFSSVHG
jgi:hypothetical protein